ncbi:hypothetical protein HNQ92_005811 [Rhabdobacter roseus]|uniref:Serine hydrolase family protein n=1 Tax=Rhabdobacter roseus TaxID=1655419 RepID=A0A840TWN5_9BACT|nr:alpha/beta hydrolase [Rhabdobacter roseus]MBB5287644.1 hypothetical protein [Rhabdobacter roseus]
MKPNIYVVPRWSGTIHSDWYDWLAEQVEARWQVPLRRLEMPHWQTPRVEEALAFLSEQVPGLDEGTFFIGHSVGCQSILRFLHQKLTPESTSPNVGGLLFVAGWLEVDEPWDTVEPWLDRGTLDLRSVRERVLHKRVLISDNDPFTSDFARNKYLWETRLGADVTLYSGQRHFNQKTAPEVLSALREMVEPAN